MTKQEAIKKIENLNVSSFNKQQKELAIQIIKSLNNEINITDAYNFLTKRIKTGFVFDQSPDQDSQKIAYLEELKEKNINITSSDFQTNTLIIGENYDALKNLIFLNKETPPPTK